MVENFFEHRLCKLDVASLSGMGFDCFRRYFCCINSQNKSLRCVIRSSLPSLISYPRAKALCGTDSRHLD
jgi:hypothetical protein